eukprot:CAMPEP_0194542152 /NCGR_PEP_ID=MMETSP0253-20130528/83520_1 /TAXON_ID=2966 /ORGANISM="Noctiluca scintillans" /LENGTH=132 /DNA_ID=CAMNT_0039388741 /DNA_START=1 /DNA_END=395 /DNA_ORIENTATION=+
MREAVRESEEFAAQGARAAEEAARAALAAAQEARARLGEPGEVEEESCSWIEQSVSAETCESLIPTRHSKAHHDLEYQERIDSHMLRRQDECASESCSPWAADVQQSESALPSAPFSLVERKGNPMWRPGGT